MAEGISGGLRGLTPLTITEVRMAQPLGGLKKAVP